MGRALCVKRGPFSVGVSSAIIYQGASQKLAASISNREQLSDGTNFGRFSSHIISQPENARSASAQTKDVRLFQSLPSSHSYPAYEMKQISADFHLISRLSGSHLNCHSYKSH
jgi:hypothetical protein